LPITVHHQILQVHFFYLKISYNLLFHIKVNRQSSDINVTWIYDDWRNIHSKNSSHGPVTDRRWKGFTKGKFDGFIMNNNVRCFSIYADGGNVTLEFTSGDLKQDIKSLNIKDDDSIDASF
jgi:hypothetical protein